MNTIKLLLSRGKWIARYQGPHAQQFINEHGTCEADTGFDESSSAGLVAQYAGEMHPGCTIEVNT